MAKHTVSGVTPAFKYGSESPKFSFCVFGTDQPGLIKIRTSVQFLARPFRYSFKEKCPLSGAKTQVQYVNPGSFYYVHIGTYCCVFIKLLQVGSAAVPNSNIQGPSLKMYALLCCLHKYALHQTQP